MIGKPFRLINGNSLGLGGNAGGRNLIIDTPAHIFCPCLPSIGPPRILLRLRIDLTEHVDKSKLVKNVSKPGAFFREKAGIFLIGSPVFQVDLLVGNIPVAA